MKRLFLSTLLVTVFATFSLAQSTDDYKKGELFIGYSANVFNPGNVDSSSTSKSSTFNGVNVSGVYNFSKYVGVKGDFSTHYKNLTDTVGSTTIGTIPPPPLVRVKVGASVQNYLAGLQFKDNSTEGRVKPFAHALVGVGRIKARASFSGSTVSEAQSGLSMAFGGGIDVRVNKRVSIRVIQADYNPIRIEGETSNGIRLGFGIVF
jgi:opacity protein-like surface antigen